ncbi:hypothetical protein GUITHDRAFT_148603, partial [Guillardia theta CCMP2712]
MSERPSAPFLDKGGTIVAARVSDIAGGGLQPYPPGGEYLAKADETPTKIAKMFGVDPFRLVKLNQGRYPDLISTSKLRSNTLITLPQKDWRWMLTRVLSKSKNEKKKKVYTVQDIEPDAHAPDHFTIFESVESKRIQSYLRTIPNSTTHMSQVIESLHRDITSDACKRSGEVVCALYPVVSEQVEAWDNSHWLTVFYP